MNLEELKSIVDKRVGRINKKQEKYLEWENTLKQLKATGFTVVIVFDNSSDYDSDGVPCDIHHALIWNSSNKKDKNGNDISRFYIAHMRERSDRCPAVHIFPLSECKLVFREHLFSTINDEEVEKIIKNCLTQNPIGFHYINTLSDIDITERDIHSANRS